MAEDKETTSVPVRVDCTPTEAGQLDELRGHIGRATYIKLLLDDAKATGKTGEVLSDPGVPVVGLACAGDGVEITPLPDNIVARPGFPLPVGTYGLLVIGDSMTRPSGKGNIPNGSIAFFRKDSFAPPGAAVHVEWQENGRDYAGIKRLTQDEKGNHHLVPLNPDFKEMEPRENIQVRGYFLRALENPSAEVVEQSAQRQNINSRTKFIEARTQQDKDELSEVKGAMKKKQGGKGSEDKAA